MLIAGIVVIGGIAQAYSYEKIHDVIVVGAGISGIAAADALQQSEYDVVVLEARDRIGGRINTDYSTGMALDLGASWIHGTKYNPISYLAQNYNIDTVSTLPELHNNSYVYYNFTGGKLSHEEKQKLDDEFDDYMNYVYKKYHVLPWYEEFLMIIDPQSQEKRYGNVSLLDDFEEFIEMKYPDIDEERKQELLHVSNLWIEQTLAGDLEHTSSLYWDMDDHFTGKEEIFPGGYSQIVNRLSEELDIRLNTVVTRIDYSKNPIVVETSNGIYKASYVVVTVPLGVLKESIKDDDSSREGAITFSPQLPAYKKEAISKIEMGVMNKAYLVFNEIFWKDDQKYDWISFMDYDKGEWSLFLDLSDYLEKPTLLGFNSGSYGEKLENLNFKNLNEIILSKSFKIGELENAVLYDNYASNLSKDDEQLYEDAVVELAMDNLKTIYGDKIPNPIEAVVTRWNSEPFSYGSYSYPGVGSTAKHFDDLGKSISGRLFFAGEATVKEYYGTVHAGFISGIRTAEEVKHQMFLDKWNIIAISGIVISFIGIVTLWTQIFKRRENRKVYLEAVGRSRDITYLATIGVVLTVILIFFAYNWFANELMLIPEFDDIKNYEDEYCYLVDTLYSTMKYLRLTEIDEHRIIETYDRCVYGY